MGTPGKGNPMYIIVKTRRRKNTHLLRKGARRVPSEASTLSSTPAGLPAKARRAAPKGGPGGRRKRPPPQPLPADPAADLQPKGRSTQNQTLTMTKLKRLSMTVRTTTTRRSLSPRRKQRLPRKDQPQKVEGGGPKSQQLLAKSRRTKPASTTILQSRRRRRRKNLRMMPAISRRKDVTS